MGQAGDGSFETSENVCLFDTQGKGSKIEGKTKSTRNRSG